MLRRVKAIIDAEGWYIESRPEKYYWQKVPRVMSYEDIEEARAKHAAKEVIKGKGKCGRKCKRAALEAAEPEPEPEPEVAQMIEAPET
jgi:hypothetical protein